MNSYSLSSIVALLVIIVIAVLGNGCNVKEDQIIYNPIPYQLHTGELTPPVLPLDNELTVDGVA